MYWLALFSFMKSQIVVTIPIVVATTRCTAIYSLCDLLLDCLASRCEQIMIILLVFLSIFILLIIDDSPYQQE